MLTSKNLEKSTRIHKSKLRKEIRFVKFLLSRLPVEKYRLIVGNLIGYNPIIRNEGINKNAVINLVNRAIRKHKIVYTTCNHLLLELADDDLFYKSNPCAESDGQNIPCLLISIEDYRNIIRKSNTAEVLPTVSSKVTRSSSTIHIS